MVRGYETASTDCGAGNLQPTEREVVQRVVISQLLFIAGHSLTSTSSGFLTYFFYEFAPSTVAIAILMTLPDVAGLLGMATRYLTAWCGGRKRLWLVSSLLARAVAAIIPLSLFWTGGTLRYAPQAFVLVCVGVWHVLQTFAFLAYLSWIADLVPGKRWGHLFASRNVAGVLVTLVLPTIVALWREYLVKDWSPDAKMISYAAVFTVGGVLSLASLLPLLTLPEIAQVPPADKSFSFHGWAGVLGVLVDRNYRYLLLHWWWLSLFQGLTQAVLWKFRISILHISLPVYLLMNALMLLLQIPMSFFGGWLCDRGRQWEACIASVAIVSFAMLPMLFAEAQSWWLLIMTHALFGVFGMVNVCLDTTSLRLAPPRDNVLHLSVLRQIGSVIAGVAGLLGGYWLDRFVASASSPDSGLDAGCRWLILISWIGRFLAAAWLLPLLMRPKPSA